MGTRSNIAYIDDDRFKGRRAVVCYCHFDGYLDNNGRILLEHYNNKYKAVELVDSGYITTLADTLEKCTRVNDNEPKVYRTESSLMYHIDPLYIEFIYLWKDEQWWVAYSRTIDTNDHPSYDRAYEPCIHYHTDFKPLEKELENWYEDNPQRNEVQIL